VTALPELFAALPEPFAAAFDAAKPWALLGEPIESLLATLPSAAIAGRVHPAAHLLGDRIFLGKGSRVAPGAVLEGPLWIGEDVEIRVGAYLRGGCWVGDACVVGANVEMKRAILLPGAHAAHLNYVGDSILGRDVNLGAGVILSNFRHDGSEISIPHAGARLSTGRRKFGAVVGDAVAIGCNAVLNPGTIVGARSQIYTGVQLRSGVYPADSLIKLRQEATIEPLRSSVST
jgi:bifunctional UDP-N-acetylglucosamine pyrophosphorylase/glucosamine-1-phosphate N-acetyltransferase